MFIKIGNTNFDVEPLKKITLNQAVERFHYIDARIVTRAWNEANGTNEKVKKEAKKTSKKSVKKTKKKEKE